MSAHHYELFDPLLPPADADRMVRLCERFGSYGMYSQEASESEIGEGLAQRHDAVMNFITRGGRRGADEPLAALAARTVHGRPVIVPAIVYANILLPGQELAMHTDVPEFRGANRKKFPQWLMVAMHHSGLFDAWRMPIVTGVSWFSECAGGAFVFHPDGAAGAAVALPAKRNTAILLDTDSVFHGVDRVGVDAELAPLRPGMRLQFDGAARWSVRNGDAIVASYAWDELRFSISWKAYCFADDAERRAWREHTDDLQLEAILDRLVEDLRSRGRITSARPSPTDLALLIIDE